MHRAVYSECVYVHMGARASRQGVRSPPGQGDQAWPVQQVITNSPYVMGADINRANVSERKFDFASSSAARPRP